MRVVASESKYFLVCHASPSLSAIATVFLASCRAFLYGSETVATFNESWHPNHHLQKHGEGVQQLQEDATGVEVMMNEERSINSSIATTAELAIVFVLVV